MLFRLVWNVSWWERDESAGACFRLGPRDPGRVEPRPAGLPFGPTHHDRSDRGGA
jgi:hypothetical protein